MAGDVLKGQAAVGTSDVGCIDVKAHDGTALRDISEIAVTDSSGNITVITKRLITTSANDFKYVKGQLTCSDGKSFNDYCEDSAVWGVSITFKLDSLSTETILAYNMVTNAGWRVYINTSGHICVQNKYSGNTASAEWSDWTVSPGPWYVLDLYGHSGGSSTVYCSVNNSSYVSKSLGRTSLFTNARDLLVGDSEVSLRNGIKIRGTNYSSSSTTVTLEVNVENASSGSTLSLTSNGRTISGGTVYQQTKTTYEWE